MVTLDSFELYSNPSEADTIRAKKIVLVRCPLYRDFFSSENLVLDQILTIENFLYYYTDSMVRKKQSSGQHVFMMVHFIEIIL